MFSHSGARSPSEEGSDRMRGDSSDAEAAHAFRSRTCKTPQGDGGETNQLLYVHYLCKCNAATTLLKCTN